jgi:hypothetical protein
MQLRFASLVVINSRWDLHPQECAHAGRTKRKPPEGGSQFKLDDLRSGDKNPVSVQQRGLTRRRSRRIDGRGGAIANTRWQRFNAAKIPSENYGATLIRSDHHSLVIS